MNDRLAAQVRQHLLDTANERPADGQLAAVLGGVAATTQRTPLVARLTWMPDRVGPFPSSTLRYGLVAVTLALAAVAALVIGAGSSSRSTDFEGTWTTTDPADASAMKLYVLAGASPQVRFEDLYATGAACVEDIVKVFTADGVGRVDGDHLAVTYPDGGGCGGRTVPMAGSYDYRSGSDTLVDPEGLVWRRVDQAPVLPVPTPATSKTPTEATFSPSNATSTAAPTSPPTAEPTSVARCADLQNGETYSREVGPVMVTARIPAGAQSSWQGFNESFEIANLCHFGRPVLIAAFAVTEIHADACDPSAGAVAIETPAMAVEALVAQQGHETTGPTTVTIAGYPAARFEILGETSTCPEGMSLWAGNDFGRNRSAVVYLVDVDGSTLGLVESWVVGEATPAQLADAEAIIETLQIEP